ncbi:hypothetical protein [Pseudomonas silesiensis]|uniref:hypothetical protein n=1 Tax=Pseudomonas silesiensis TaxID=1853130 RepID=UPI0030DB5929
MKLAKIFNAKIVCIIPQGNSMSLVLIKLFLVFGPLLIGFIGIGVNCYVACRDLNAILDIFKKSYVVTSYGDIWGGGSFSARCVLASIISGVVLFPKKHIRNWTLDPEELACLPASIKLRMRWSVGLMFVGVVSLVGLVVIAESLKRLAGA